MTWMKYVGFFLLLSLILVLAQLSLIVLTYEP
jgi:hypothetical protein